MNDVSLTQAVERMARGDAFTLIVGRRAMVVMPRWYYVAALIGCLALGLVIGWSA
jgi:hypothetical protein